MNSLRKMALGAMIAGMVVAPTLVSADRAGRTAPLDRGGTLGNTGTQSPTDTGSLAVGGGVGFDANAGLQNSQSPNDLPPERSGLRSPSFQDRATSALERREAEDDRMFGGDSQAEHEETRFGARARDLPEHESLTDLETAR
jgi:hypothetical protein